MDDSRLTENLHKLAIHWDVYCAQGAQDENERELYKQCAKQLRQRTEWMEQEISAHFRNAIAAILESFMNSGWIERFNMINDRVTIWHSETGAQQANDLLIALPKNSSHTSSSQTESLLRLVCQWIAEHTLGTSPSSHQIEHSHLDIASLDQ